MAFDLGAMLKDVSNLGTDREQIEYIRLELIDSDEKNFYELSDLDGLANNIATIGLQQPLRLRRHPTEAERYIIVSGHRRRAALELLAKEEPERWTEVACIVEQSAVSPALQQLCLIFGNSNTRKLSSSDLSEQAAQVERLLYQLKEEGYEFPGRMRDHVAQVVQVSKTKLARLKMIRDNLAECWQGPYKHNKLVEDTAYSLAQLPLAWQQSIFDYFGESRSFNSTNVKIYRDRFQQIDKLMCQKPGRECSCQNAAMKREKAIATNSWSSFNCGKCCSSCPDLVSCKYACPVMATRIGQLRADNRAARKQEIAAQKEADRPAVEQVTELWHRFGSEREMAGLSVEAIKCAMGCYCFPDDAEKYEKLESGTAKITTGTKLPYLLYRQDVLRLIAVANLFGCSIDYLLCRTDVREIAQEKPVPKVSESDTEHRDIDIIPGTWYPTSVEPPVDVEIITVDRYEYVESCFYLGAGMLKNAVCTEWKDVVLWSLLPQKANTTEWPEMTTEKSANNELCWQIGKPTIPGDYILLIQYDKRSPMRTELWEWDGARWVDDTCVFEPDVDGDILGWMPMPNGIKESETYFNSQCTTGLNPYGHCGSAACCTESYACCRDCPEPCNSRGVTMANEERLIDANALLAKFWEPECRTQTRRDFCAMVNYAPIVEVVRCKKCKHRADVTDDGNYLCNRKMIGLVRPNDFCSFGERMIHDG